MSKGTAACPILVVDDDADIRELLVEILQDHGHRTVGAENGLVALEKLRGGFPACVILLDLMMPIMDGPSFRAAQQSDPRFSPIKVVVMSAQRSATMSLTALSPTHVLEKPFDMQHLLRVVDDCCQVPCGAC
jgi:CheY-like chemotaxis protein